MESRDQEYTHLTRMNIPIVKLPTTQPWGLRSVWFRDPDSNIVNFYANLTGSQPPEGTKALERKEKPMTDIELAIPYSYKIIELPSFDLLGFTKIVKSGGEQYNEVRSTDQWNILRQMAGSDKTIYGIASFDKECTKDHYRYTLAVKAALPVKENTDDGKALFPFHVKQSTWCAFTLDHFTKQYGDFWGHDPYAMIQKLGYDFNNRLNIHIDVYPEAYQTDDDAMEFWMPIKNKKP